LGYRHVNYKPNPLDFATYQSLCKGFLCSQRGQAALLAGGILAQIARDYIPDDEVYMRPSHDVYSSGVCFVKDSESGASYWDDQLTDDEINLLCGVYMVETGHRDGNDHQQTMLSWFPKPAAWATSGLNVGFWTSDCESWYQKRLQENMSESAVLRSTNQWRHSLCFLKRSQRV
ncbi:uncharacterized protein EV420DRAFT_1236530, partial [Desarmillaria tabescens]